jgi:protein-tyrosine-phosphatase
VARVLFVCLHNAGRSQIAQALFERAAEGRHQARSAGTLADPDGRPHPQVVEAMREVGLDVAERRPRRLAPAADGGWADVVVTMGCGDACPRVPGTRHLDWDLPDPAGRPLAEVRALRNEIARRIRRLVAELDAS